ncbi:MAG: hypothetical protein JSV65_02330 [Armatimonadota bacterium]|nr:MAG: hypothetical protein JSV65_02330 [Armatimonadota bacterium]
MRIALATLIWLVMTSGACLAASDISLSLRERYLGPDGLPSEAAYLQAEGIAPAPGSESWGWRVVFKLTYLAKDVEALDRATPVATDCYLVRTRRFVAPYRAAPAWDGRVYQADGGLVVGAYTPDCEQVVGRISADGVLVALAPGGDSTPLLRGGEVRYNPFTGQLWRREPGGAMVEEQCLYLPFPLVGAKGEPVRCGFEIARQEGVRFALVARAGDGEVALATCAVTEETIIKRGDGYAPVLGPGCVMAADSPTAVLEVQGELCANALDMRGATLVLRNGLPDGEMATPRPRIDGDFSEWRDITGIADPRGDIPWYLDYNADTDLLEFKVASDARHLYFYTRVAGRHGNTAPGDDRYYYYVYIDADRDAATGYVPTRDDNCYHGVALGDDCEAQFEFVGGRFVKTFFGFTGVGTEKEVLAGRVTLGPSWYGKHDERGRLRDRYKVEYVRRAGKRHITADYTEGTSEDIIIALSPDGSECEMRAELAGFLHDSSGKLIIGPGQRIDLAVGVEASGAVQGNERWGADSTAPIYGYRVAPE